MSLFGMLEGRVSSALSLSASDARSAQTGGGMNEADVHRACG